MYETIFLTSCVLLILSLFYFAIKRFFSFTLVDVCNSLLMLLGKCLGKYKYLLPQKMPEVEITTLNSEELSRFAKKALDFKKYKYVEKYLVELLSRDDSRDITNYQMLSKSYLKRKDYKKALLILEEGLKQYDDALLYTYYGDALVGISKIESAFSVFRKSLDLRFDPLIMKKAVICAGRVRLYKEGRDLIMKNVAKIGSKRRLGYLLRKLQSHQRKSLIRSIFQPFSDLKKSFK